MTERNTPDRVRNVLKVYAPQGGDQLILEWTAGAENTPIADGYPSELKLIDLDNVRLVSLFAFPERLNTVLTALEVSEADFRQIWTRSYSPHRFRIQRKGQGFEIRSVS